GAGANISACTVLILGRVFPTENSVQAENTEFTTIRETILISMGNSLFVALFALIASSFHTRAALQAEILALRHQLAVLQANAPRHLRLKRSDRVLWLFLSRFWSVGVLVSKSCNPPQLSLGTAELSPGIGHGNR